MDHQQPETPSVLHRIKQYLSWRLLAGIAIGAVGGYAYYYFVGCQGGTCPITSNPWRMVAYGMLFGAVVGFGKKTD